MEKQSVKGLRQSSQRWYGKLTFEKNGKDLSNAHFHCCYFLTEPTLLQTKKTLNCSANASGCQGICRLMCPCYPYTKKVVTGKCDL